MANNALAYGFVDMASQSSQRISEVGARTVFDAVVSSAKYHTAQLNAVLSGMCQRTTDFKWRFKLPTGGTLQPLDEHGRPLPTKGLTYYDVALPIQMGGDSNGMTFISAAKATVEEANAMTLTMQQKDSDWVVRHILASIFTNTSWTFTDPYKGALTIQPLANADMAYPIIGGTTESSQHYLAQAAAIADATNPFPTMYAQLAKHPGNMTATQDVVVYVPSNVRTAIEGLASFVALGDPDVGVGANSDRIVASAARIAGIRGPGDEVLGKVDKCWIVEWKRLPDSYLIGQALGAGPVVGFREEPEAELQGLIVKNDQSDVLSSQTIVIRRAGFGIINRVGMVVQRVSNGSYAIPTGYEAPLSV